MTFLSKIGIITLWSLKNKNRSYCMYSAINHIMKKMIMHMRTETVDEFLQRGGTVTKIPEVLDTVGSWWGYQERYQAESIKDGTQQVVSWKSVQPDERFDTEDDDRKYWKKLDRRCDQLLKKMKAKK